MENDLMLLRQMRKAQVLYSKYTKFRIDYLNGGVPTEHQKKWESEVIIAIEKTIDDACKVLHALIEDKLSDRLNEAELEGMRDADEQEKECWNRADSNVD